MHVLFILVAIYLMLYRLKKDSTLALAFTRACAWFSS